MKKFILSILTILLLTLSACSNQDQLEEFDYVIYDTDSATFLYINEYDILYPLQSYEKEFFIAYNHFSSEQLSETEENAYRNFLIKLDTLAVRGTPIFSYSSDQFRDFLEQSDTTVTIEDIFVFNSMKNVLEEMDKESITFEKHDFVQLYSNEEINEEMFHSYDEIQDLITELHMTIGNISILDYTFEEFIELVNQELGTTYTAETNTSLKETYEMIERIYQKGEPE